MVAVLNFTATRAATTTIINMHELSQLIHLPFIQRAFLGGIIISVLASWMGVLVVLRKSSFFGDAIAHSSLLGVSLGLLLGLNPILVATLYAILVSLLLPLLKKHSQLPLDSLLGFILPFSMGLGIIVLSIIPGYQPELMSFLFGSILSISWSDIYVTASLVVATLLIMFKVNKRLILSSFDHEYAKISGVNVYILDTIYHVLLAVTVVSGIRLVGIILVNALLVIPSSTSRLVAKSLLSMFILTPIFALLATITGLFASFYLNIPAGPAIAVISGLIFILVLPFSRR